MVQIMDHLHWQIEKTNARAITEGFKAKLKYLIRHPKPLEERLTLKKGTRYYEDVVLVFKPNQEHDFIALELRE
jgi:hypothetical protein